MKNKTYERNKNIYPDLKQYIHNHNITHTNNDIKSMDQITIDLKDNIVKELNDELKHGIIIDTINIIYFKIKKNERKNHIHYEDNKYVPHDSISYFSRKSRFSHLSKLSHNTRQSKNSNHNLKYRHKKRKHKHHKNHKNYRYRKYKHAF